MLGLRNPFEEAIDDALNSLPGDLHAAMSNVEILVDDGAPDWQHVVLQITRPPWSFRIFDADSGLLASSRGRRRSGLLWRGLAPDREGGIGSGTSEGRYSLVLQR
jgi:hypothetical protein